MSTIDERAAALPADHFLTVLPGAASANAGIVFKGKNAAGETVDAWPEVVSIKPDSWAASEGFINPGATLVSINGAAAPATFALAKDVLKAAAAATTAADPFIELVWRAGAEEGTPPMALSMSVRQWAVLSWNKRWLKYSGGVLSLYNTAEEPSEADQPLLEVNVTDPTASVSKDAYNANRVLLDNGVALVHLKFDDGAQREALFDAFASAPASAPATAGAPAAGGAEAPAAVQMSAADKKRYPFHLGKYWLGPINPGKAWGADSDEAGGFAFVMAGINSETGERICAKINHNVDFEGSAEQKKEIMLHAALKHANVVNITDIIKEHVPEARGKLSKKKMLVIIMEIMKGGEMFAEVVDNGGLPEARARTFARQILLGLAYCHNRNIAHRDIKLENLLLTADRQTCKIADFGLAKVATGGMDMTVIGTIKYMAPEMFEGDTQGGNDHRLCDIWAAGVCLFCTTECKFPFTVGGTGGAGGHGVQKASQENIATMKAIKASKWQLKPGRSPEYLAFLKKLLCVDPATRYTAATALKDPWVMGDDWTEAMVDTMLGEMDGAGIAGVPTSYSEADWIAHVSAMAQEEDGPGGAEPEPEEDEEDGF